MRRRARRDANHPAIVLALEAVGASVQELHAVGGGVPDLLVAYRQTNYLLEVKDASTAYGSGRKDNAVGSNARQAAWRLRWRAPVHVVTSIEEALEAIGAVRRGDAA